MAVTLTSPDYDSGLTGVTFVIDREDGTSTTALSATEVSAYPGTYSLSTTVTNAPVGYNRVRMFDSDDVLRMIFAVQVIADGSATVTGGSVQGLRDRAGNQAEHDATQASLASLASTGRVTVVNPVDNTGKITGAIVIGDDYLAANSRAFSWTIPAISGVTAATSVPWFGGKLDNDNAWLVDGTLTVDGSNWVLSFDLAKEDTLSLDAGYYAWSVEVKSSTGVEITRVRSDTNQVQLVEKQT